MAMPRRVYTPRTVTSMMFWSDDLYSLESLSKAEAAEQDTNVKTFIACMIAYRGKLKENNPCYDNPEATPEVIQFLDQLEQLANKVRADDEFVAAVYNLRGLVLCWLKKHDESLNDFAIACAKTNIPLTKAILFSNMGLTLEEQENETVDYLESHKEAVKVITTLNPTDTESKHTMGSIYCAIAKAYRAKGLVDNFDDSLKSFDEALKWSSNPVISNNRAIILSKIDTLETLELAEKYLEKAYPQAKEKAYFVVPFYRADVTIKLAARNIKANRIPDVLKQIENAQEYIATARAAVVTANYATSAEKLTDYQNKALARLFKLEANLAFIQGNEAEARRCKEQAIAYRQKVKETPAKTAKFIAGMDFIDRPFSTVSVLFRYPLLSPEVISNAKVAAFTSKVRSRHF
jgi:hypothetical protein